MWCLMVSKLIYVIVLANLLLINETKSVKRYKRRNEDLLNNLNNTFATLMNIMMVDPSENGQLPKEVTKEFSKDQFTYAAPMQSSDYQDLLSNNSIYNQPLQNYDKNYESMNNGYNSNNAFHNSGYSQSVSGRQFDQSPSISNYFNPPSSKNNLENDFSNSYGNQIIQHQNGYLSQEQFANAPTYMDNNPPSNQIEINQNENSPSSNIIVDDNFNHLSSNSLLDSESFKDNPSKSTNYLTNSYSDASKYGKIKISDFVNSDSASVKNKQNLHFYELVNEDNALTMGDLKKKPIPVTTNTVPLKYMDEKKSSYGSFRSFGPEFEADFDQFRITTNTPKVETNSNYFDHVKTKDPIVTKTTTTTYDTQPNYNNYNNPSNGYSNNLSNGLSKTISNSLSSSISNSLSNSFSNNFPNNQNHPPNGEQRITPNQVGNEVATNKLMNGNLGYMVSNNNDQQFPTAITNNHLQLPLVIPYNQNTPVEISNQVPTQKGVYSNFGYGGQGSYSLGHGGKIFCFVFCKVK